MWPGSEASLKMYGLELMLESVTVLPLGLVRGDGALCTRSGVACVAKALDGGTGAPVASRSPEYVKRFLGIMLRMPSEGLFSELVIAAASKLYRGSSYHLSIAKS